MSGFDWALLMLALIALGALGMLGFLRWLLAAGFASWPWWQQWLLCCGFVVLEAVTRPIGVALARKFLP